MKVLALILVKKALECNLSGKDYFSELKLTQSGCLASSDQEVFLLSSLRAALRQATL